MLFGFFVCLFFQRGFPVSSGSQVNWGQITPIQSECDWSQSQVRGLSPVFVKVILLWFTHIARELSFRRTIWELMGLCSPSSSAGPELRFWFSQHCDTAEKSPCAFQIFVWLLCFLPWALQTLSQVPQEENHKCQTCVSCVTFSPGSEPLKSWLLQPQTLVFYLSIQSRKCARQIECQKSHLFLFFFYLFELFLDSQPLSHPWTGVLPEGKSSPQNVSSPLWVFFFLPRISATEAWDASTVLSSSRCWLFLILSPVF